MFFSFIPCVGSQESDIRFVYCAVAISYILNDFSYINIPKTIEFILRLQSYDGGFSQTPNMESHVSTNKS